MNDEIPSATNNPSPKKERDWREMGIIELAVENQSVSDYITHWEGRALEAERKLALLNYLPDGYDIGDDATAAFAVELAEKDEVLRRCLAVMEDFERHERRECFTHTKQAIRQVTR